MAQLKDTSVDGNLTVTGSLNVVGNLTVSDTKLEICEYVMSITLEENIYCAPWKYYKNISVPSEVLNADGFIGIVGAYCVTAGVQMSTNIENTTIACASYLPNNNLKIRYLRVKQS